MDEPRLHPLMGSRWAAAPLALLALLSAPGCLPGLELDTSCGGDADCYHGEVCQLPQGICVPTGAALPADAGRDAQAAGDVGPGADGTPGDGGPDAHADAQPDGGDAGAPDAGLELCNGADDDGDGATDEELQPPGDLCSVEGLCAGSVPSCLGVDGWVCPLPPGYEPTPEQSCDGLDNDCNGTVDDAPDGCACVDDEQEACGQDRGTCRAGVHTCDDGRWGPCEGGQGPTDERCNGEDDDCDEATDEAAELQGAPPCPELGVCAGSSAECRGAAGWACPEPARYEDDVETSCDGLDNDCDGATDELEGLSPDRECLSEGVCQGTQPQCVGAQGWSCMYPALYLEGPESVCDGFDNDCNGLIDDVAAGCQCELGQQQGCGSDEGECVSSTQTCGADGTWGVCEGAVLPTQEECNGLDDDCDTETDEGLAEVGRQCGQDEGECTQGVLACLHGALLCQGSQPAVPERCNGLDDDCDGATDEDEDTGGCSCFEAETRPCGVELGACQPGQQTCGPLGEWGPCQGAVGPTDETCNGVDDDCDDATDEEEDTGGCDCVAGEQRACGSAVGECRPGTQACSAQGRWSSCDGAVGPAGERCDGLDNDCDGQDDNGFDTGDECFVGEGACRRAGVRVCTPDAESTECGAVAGNPSVEVCDGEDNDCDGRIDVDFVSEGAACGSDVGECRVGVWACEQGELRCAGERAPEDERCNGLDDDCDGRSDEDNPEGGAPCGVETGQCRQGVLVCRDGALGCAGEVAAVPERCNGLDDDCDGVPDNGDPEGGAACGSNVGECVAGVVHCTNAELVCEGGVGPTAERCDGLDNDCSGTPDETFPGAGDPCGSDVGACRPGAWSCVDATVTCVGEQGPTLEICDGVDNDCNGATDDIVPACECLVGDTSPCGVDVGECELGTSHCLPNGTWGPCEGGVGPTDEVCNGLDEDCSGTPDDNIPPRDACTVGEGICSAEGVMVCIGARWQCDADAGPPAPEVCNGLDDDCNGAIDEAEDLRPPSALNQHGVCAGAVQFCAGSDGWVEPDYGALPGYERRESLCDGQDNDCDGAVDEQADLDCLNRLRADAICLQGQCIGATEIFQDSFSGQANGWITEALQGPANTLWRVSNERAISGSWAWHSGPSSEVGGDVLLRSPEIDLTNMWAGQRVVLRFWHLWKHDSCGDPNFQADGGLVQILTLAGDQQRIDVAPVGGYPGTIEPGACSNPLQGRDAYTRSSEGLFQEARVDLSAFVGDRIQIEFHVGWDCGNCNVEEGWWLEDVGVYALGVGPQ